MRILLIFTLISFITGVSFIVTGYSNGTVIINCHYSKGQESSDKYFCMGPAYSLSCKGKIRTGIKNSWYHNGRFSLYDDTVGNYFMVVIRQLTRQDEGTYWCGVDKPVIVDSYTEVDLKVKEETCCEKSVPVTAYLGGGATFICNYSEDVKFNTKYVCKQSKDNKTCDDINSHSAGRFSLTDISTERRYTVTISNLTEDDTGTYWCGLNTSYIALFTKVQLVMTATTHTPKAKPLFIRPGTTVATLLFVSVVVLLILIIVIKDYRQRNNKTTVISSANMVNSDAVSNREGCHGDGFYEVMNSLTRHSDAAAVSSAHRLNTETGINIESVIMVTVSMRT
ncbi:hypothetical protein UPYG_G00272270 [Umbra pygmaea]|uniref:Ig-like domain-containing protein n=1 Tax=Umbra pygmaea TaxID=75934 RepID=A0ABD0WX17_UMBPY